MVDVIKKAYSTVTREDSAEYMAELLMDDENSTYKMYEELASAYLDGNDEYRKGLNDAVIMITGWSLDTISKRLLDGNILVNDVEAENDEFKVVLTYIGEGHFGDYNDEDEEDEPLIRLDVYCKDEYGEWDDEVIYSTCTDLSARCSEETAGIWAKKILDNIMKLKDTGNGNPDDYCLTAWHMVAADI